MFESTPTYLPTSTGLNTGKVLAPTGGRAFPYFQILPFFLKETRDVVVLKRVD